MELSPYPWADRSANFGVLFSDQQKKEACLLLEKGFPVIHL